MSIHLFQILYACHTRSVLTNRFLLLYCHSVLNGLIFAVGGLIFGGIISNQHPLRITTFGGKDWGEHYCILSQVKDMLLTILASFLQVILFWHIYLSTSSDLL